MSGIDEGLVGKGQEFVVERAIQVGAEVVSTPPKRRTQVRAADVSDEKRIAGEDSVRVG